MLDLDAVKLDTPLQDGDIQHVPPMRCAILGKATKPGQVLLRGSDTLEDVCGSAGVRVEGLKQIVILRAVDVEAGNDKREVYDLDPSGVPKVPVLDGDVVYLPDGSGDPLIWMFAPRQFYYDRVLFSI